MAGAPQAVKPFRNARFGDVSHVVLSDLRDSRPATCARPHQMSPRWYKFGIITGMSPVPSNVPTPVLGRGLTKIASLRDEAYER